VGPKKNARYAVLEENLVFGSPRFWALNEKLKEISVVRHFLHAAPPWYVSFVSAIGHYPRHGSRSPHGPDQTYSVRVMATCRGCSSCSPPPPCSSGPSPQPPQRTRGRFFSVSPSRVQGRGTCSRCSAYNQLTKRRNLPPVPHTEDSSRFATTEKHKGKSTRPT
jgi:hypothetical protein